MTGTMSFLAIGPVVAISAAVILLLMADVTLKPPRWVWAIVSGAGVLAATGLAGWQWWWVAQDDNLPRAFFNGMIALDGFGAFAGLVIFPLAGLGLLSGWRLAASQERRGAEFVALVLLAAAGAHLMAASANLIMLFIGLEVFSISLYVLVGFTRERADADEAALKYFLLGAFASAVFLYGVALVFAATGSTSIAAISSYLTGTLLFKPGILLVGIALLLVGMGFKVSAAPFHVWSPDVYQGAPGGITGFVAATAKVAGFAALARVLVAALGARIDDWAPAVAALAALSVVVGTLLAIVQDDVKRLLAYSSVAHAGFILTALVAGTDGIGGMWFYATTYAAQVVGAFTIAAVVGGDTEGRVPLERFSGLGRRAPWLAGTMSLMLLAMAGIPVTAGFVGKVAVFRAAIDAGYLWLVITAALAVVAGLFFYLRIIVLMYMQAPADDSGEAPGVGFPARIALAVAAAATIVFGVAPWPLLDVVRDALPF